MTSPKLQLDLAKVMAEMFKLGDKNKDEVLELFLN